MSAAIATAAGMAQHDAATATERDLAYTQFREVQELAQQLATETLARKAHLHSEEAALERKLSSNLRSQALEFSRRENLRDTWVAHNGHVQATLFVATVLIGFGYEILSGAIISDAWHAQHPGLVTLFFAATLLSIAFGLVALSFLLVRYRRLSEFRFTGSLKEYACGHVHLEMMNYIECRCRHLQKWTHYALVASMAMGVAAVMVFAFDKFQNDHDANTAGLDSRESSSAAASAQIDGQNNNNNNNNNNATENKKGTVRTIGAPTIFSFIVGLSVGVVVVLDAAVLSSDTLMTRPELSAGAFEQFSPGARGREQQSAAASPLSSSSGLVDCEHDDHPEHDAASAALNGSMRNKNDASTSMSMSMSHRKDAAAPDLDVSSVPGMDRIVSDEMMDLPTRGQSLPSPYSMGAPLDA